MFPNLPERKPVDPDVATMYVVLVLASVGMAAWSLVGVIKDEIDAVRRNRR